MTNIQVTGFGARIGFNAADNQKYCKDEAPPESPPLPNGDEAFEGALC